MVNSAGAIFVFESVIRGHHASKVVWTPAVGESLQVQHEPSNPYDSHAVAVQKNGSIVGYIPREVRNVFFSFLVRGGSISCEVIGHRKYGKGLEVPCQYTFIGNEEIIKKAKKTL